MWTGCVYVHVDARVRCSDLHCKTKFIINFGFGCELEMLYNLRVLDPLSTYYNFACMVRVTFVHAKLITYAHHTVP